MNNKEIDAVLGVFAERFPEQWENRSGGLKDALLEKFLPKPKGSPLVEKVADKYREVVEGKGVAVWTETGWKEFKDDLAKALEGAVGVQDILYDLRQASADHLTQQTIDNFFIVLERHLK